MLKLRIDKGWLNFEAKFSATELSAMVTAIGGALMAVAKSLRFFFS